MLFDSHTHLQLHDFDADRPDIIARAADAGVQQMLCIGFSEATSTQATELAEKHEGIHATVGIHPHEASHLTEATLDRLRNWADSSSVVALGEMGLDFYRNLSPREDQYHAFEVQLQLAAELRLPVVIHDRDAHDEILRVLQNHRGRVRGVMHCFSGDWEMAKKCMDLGFVISIAGPVTYRKSHQLQDVATRVPISRLLIETDCPWLAPQFRRGKRNEPSYVRAVAERVAKLRGISFDELASATTANAASLFLNGRTSHGVF